MLLRFLDFIIRIRPEKSIAYETIIRMVVNPICTRNCKLGGWTDIVSIATSYGATVGLKADGTVVACGSKSFGVNEAKRWRDIVAISVGNGSIVGLKANGTVVAAGQDADDWLDVSSWKNIRVEG